MYLADSGKGLKEIFIGHNNTGFTRCSKIIGTPFYTLINLKLQKKRPFLKHFTRRQEVVITRATIDHFFATHYFFHQKNSFTHMQKNVKLICPSNTSFEISLSTEIHGSISLYHQTLKKHSTKATPHKL